MSLIISGRVEDCQTPVEDWSAHGMQFKKWQGCRPRREMVDSIVLHWTAAENPAESVFRTLINRRLSIHFVVDRDGLIWQMADPGKLACFHAGRRINDRSIGIEIVNYGSRWRGWKYFGLNKAPLKGRDRPLWHGRLGGRQRVLADFYDAQYNAVDWLIESLVEAFPGIAVAVPRETDGRHADRVLSRSELAAFSGICGHYHVSSRKSDPGPAIIHTIANLWGV